MPQKSQEARRRKHRLRARFLPRMGHGLGHLGVQEMGTSPKVAKRQRKTPLSGWKAVFLWLRGLDLNQRPPGYEPDELPTALPRDMVPETGVEPARDCSHGILSPGRLPIPPLRQRVAPVSIERLIILAQCLEAVKLI